MKFGNCKLLALEIALGAKDFSFGVNLEDEDKNLGMIICTLYT